MSPASSSSVTGNWSAKFEVTEDHPGDPRSLTQKSKHVKQKLGVLNGIVYLIFSYIFHNISPFMDR